MTYPSAYGSRFRCGKFRTNTSWRVLCTFPYIPFSEPVAVFSDRTANGGSQKVTHYGGTTTIINSVHGHSYTIFPEMDEMVCHNTTSCVDESHEYTQCKKKGARPHGVLQHLFPENLALFKATGATKFIRRCRF
mmetsp:Transcript_32962/g.53885  ORF Transcript_32962/g.53885 Transcript_32962/m.53885 type:complete len:134 (+) Transcript_32962:318-719(+)